MDDQETDDGRQPQSSNQFRYRARDLMRAGTIVPGGQRNRRQPDRGGPVEFYLMAQAVNHKYR